MNNVSCKRTYEKAWRSHLHTGLMLKAGVKQLNQRRKAPQICFKENCTFFRYIPKQLHAFILICCAYSIKCSAFYNSVCLCWSLSGRGLGAMQCGKGCWAGKHHVRATATLHVTQLPVDRAPEPVQGVALVSQWLMDPWTLTWECCMGAAPCKESVLSQGNGAALLSFQQRWLFLGQGVGWSVDAQFWPPNVGRVPGTSSVHKCRQF